jgi:flagellar hook-associated protein 2
MAEITNNVTSYDYSMIGSFGSEATQSLNGEMINKIRAAEEKAVLDPIVENLDNWELESEKITELQTLLNNFLETIKPFDLFSSTNNAFEQISASTTGSSAIFDASDVGGLAEGTYVVDIQQMAQKDVWQSSGYTQAASEAALTDSGTLTITGAGGATVDITEVNGMTLQEIADQINLSDIATASLEQTGDDEYKLVIKSTEPGVDNALSFSGTSALATDYNDATDADGNGFADNHPQVAQNLQATIDGVNYNVSSNSITVDGNLKVTATEIGQSTLSISKDDSSIVSTVQDMVNAYNEVAAFITVEVYDSESVIEDKSSLRDMLSHLKNMFFNNYGLNDENAINMGLSFDKEGLLTLDTGVLGEALTEDYDAVKDFFLGAAEDKGLGTLMKEYIDGINSYDGLMASYAERMLDRKETLEEEKQKTIDSLDIKYNTMASQFAAYAAIIAQMESSFSGLKMMIQQSTASN